MQQIEEENKKNELYRFIKFNVIIISIIILLYILSVVIPFSNSKIKSPFVLNQILPLTYFAAFSFFFGAIFLIGNVEMSPLLTYYFHNYTLDIGIIAAYTGALSVIMSIFLKNIIQNILGVKIISSPIHDVFGFILGRIILLLIVNKTNLDNILKLFN